MKPTRIWASKEEPLISRGHGKNGRHKDDGETVLIPLGPITIKRDKGVDR